MSNNSLVIRTEEFRELCQLIGLIALFWAWAENVLATTIGIIAKHAGPIPGHPQAPLSLKRRVRCLKAALRDIPALHLVQEDGRALAERFIELGLRRHDFVHGAAWQVQEGGFEAVAVGVKAGEYATKNHRFDVADARILESQIAKLSDDATAFMLRVDHIFRG